MDFCHTTCVAEAGQHLSLALLYLVQRVAYTICSQADVHVLSGFH
jgi:uncharacterized MAPEG superfamily protein